MCSPRISIIIPCYNMEKYLSECMDSVLRQTLVNIEVICINDGSTDDTPNILDGYQRSDPRVNVIHQTNRGVAAARNTGIISAAGEYIAFMDPDDFYPNTGTLELLYTKAHANNALICGGSFSRFNDLTKEVFTDYTGDLQKITFNSEGYIVYRDYQFDYGYHRFLYDRKFLLENGILFPPYTRFQDPPFFVKAMITAKSFYAIPDVVYRYRCGHQAAPSTWPRAKLHDMLRGYRDNLVLSSQAELCELHALTVRRLESAEDTYLAIMDSLKENDQKTLNLLIQINAAINTELLKQSGMMSEDTDCYNLRELRDFLNITSSYSYRIGRAITFFPRKIAGFIRCVQESGIRYTISYAVKKLVK